MNILRSSGVGKRCKVFEYSTCDPSVPFIATHMLEAKPRLDRHPESLKVAHFPANFVHAGRIISSWLCTRLARK